MQPRKPSTLLSFFSLSKTIGDTSDRVTDFDIPCYDANIHCYSNPVYYGDGTVMSAKILVGDVAFFQNVNLRDIHLKNVTAGSDAEVVIVATVPSAFIKQELGL